MMTIKKLLAILMLALVIPIGISTVSMAAPTAPSYLNLRDKPTLEAAGGVNDIVQVLGFPSLGVKNDLLTQWEELATTTGPVAALGNLGDGIFLGAVGFGTSTQIIRSTQYGDGGITTLATVAYATPQVPFKLLATGKTTAYLFTLDALSHYTSDQGASWQDTGTVGALTTLRAVEYLGNGVLLAGGIASGAPAVYRSVDGGATWGHIESVPSASDTQSTTVMAIRHVEGSTVLCLTTASLYRSVNMGLTWTEVTPGQFQQMEQGILADLVTTGTLNNIIMVAYGGHRLLRSTDGGASWSLMDTVQSGVSKMEYVGFGLTIGLQQYYPYIVYTSDGGYLWTQEIDYGGPTAANSLVSLGYGNVIIGGATNLYRNIGGLRPGSGGGTPVPSSDSAFTVAHDFGDGRTFTAFAASSTGWLLGDDSGNIVWVSSDGSQVIEGTTNLGSKVTSLGELSYAVTFDGKLWYSPEDINSWTDITATASGTGDVLAVTWAHQSDSVGRFAYIRAGGTMWSRAKDESGWTEGATVSFATSDFLGLVGAGQWNIGGTFDSLVVRSEGTSSYRSVNNWSTGAFAARQGTKLLPYLSSTGETWVGVKRRTHPLDGGSYYFSTRDLVPSDNFGTAGKPALSETTPGTWVSLPYASIDVGDVISFAHDGLTHTIVVCQDKILIREN